MPGSTFLEATLLIGVTADNVKRLGEKSSYLWNLAQRFLLDRSNEATVSGLGRFYVDSKCRFQERLLVALWIPDDDLIEGKHIQNFVVGLRRTG